MKKLRSQAWFGREGRDGFLYRSWMKNQGWPHDLFDGRPVIGICNTWSELTPCNAHFREIAEFVKRGVWEAGGFPLEFPVMSLGETHAAPDRHAVSEPGQHGRGRVDSRQSHRRSCSADGLRQDDALVVDGSGFLRSAYDWPFRRPHAFRQISGPRPGIGNRAVADDRSGALRRDEGSRSFFEAESCMHRSKGHCMTMGTASTMASMVEALGMSLPGNAAIPAVDARRNTLAQLTGRRIVQMVREDLCMSRILTREAFENAICANAAIGGSTNAVIHLIAIAGRIGVPLCLDDFDRLGSSLCLAWSNIQPSGKYLMEDFFYAGGLPAVLRELGEAGVLNRDALTVNGQSMWKNVAEAPCWNRDVIRRFAEPFKANAGIAVLRGNLRRMAP